MTISLTDLFSTLNYPYIFAVILLTQLINTKFNIFPTFLKLGVAFAVKAGLMGLFLLTYYYLPAESQPLPLAKYGENLFLSMLFVSVFYDYIVKWFMKAVTAVLTSRPKANPDAAEPS